MADWKNPSDAIWFVWRPARWANWMFEVASHDAATDNYTFGRGGNQGARGENSGGDFYIQDVFEELDYPGEFFFNRSTKQLYLWYNGTCSTGPNPDRDLTLTLALTLT